LGRGEERNLAKILMYLGSRELPSNTSTTPSSKAGGRGASTSAASNRLYAGFRYLGYQEHINAPFQNLTTSWKKDGDVPKKGRLTLGYGPLGCDSKVPIQWEDRRAMMMLTGLPESSLKKKRSLFDPQSCQYLRGGADGSQMRAETQGKGNKNDDTGDDYEEEYLNQEKPSNSTLLHFQSFNNTWKDFLLNRPNN